MMRAVIWIVCAVALGAGSAHADEGNEARLLAIADDGSKGHAAAQQWWQGLPKPDQVRVLRSALHAKVPMVAQIAAASIGFPYLDADELRLAQQLLRARPFWSVSDDVFGLGLKEERSFGASDVMPFWTAVVEDPSVRFGQTETAHKSMRGEHIQALVALLEKANGDVCTSMLWCIAQVARQDHDDRFRADVARAYLYGLRRFRAERAGTSRPKLAVLEVETVSSSGGGLPASYLEIAAGCFGDATDGYQLDPKYPSRPLTMQAPRDWLRRWSLSLTPGVRDVVFLDRIIDAVIRDTSPFVFGRAHLFWAVEALAGMPTQVERVRAWSTAADQRAVHAAAALSQRGEPQRFRELVALADQRSAARKTTGEKEDFDDPLYDVRELLWLVDRPEARSREMHWLLAQKPPPNDEARTDAESQRWRSFRPGGPVTDADHAWIEDELWRRDAPWQTLVTFYRALRPGSFTEERARALVKKLGEANLSGDDIGHMVFEFVWVLGEAELLAPQGVRSLLRSWVTQHPSTRVTVFPLLARLRVLGDEDTMMETWRQWDERERWKIGCVPSVKVRAFLTKHVQGDDLELASAALGALLVHLGCPARVVQRLDVWRLQADVWDTPEGAVIRSARESLAKDDVVGAAIAIASFDERPLYPLGALADPRVITFLRSRQAARHLGQYWDATAGLAIAGHADAREQFTKLLQDERAQIADGLVGEAAGGDRSLTDVLLHSLDTNCCMGFAAHDLLKKIYPTLPWDSGYGGAGERVTREWVRRFAWRRSPLLDGLGWLPTRK